MPPLEPDLDRALLARRAARRARAILPLVLALLAPGVRAAAEPRCLDHADVCLEVREEGRTISFVVANREASPYTVRLLVTERHNLEPLAPLPFRAVLDPGEQKVMGVLAILDADQANRYALRWDAAQGDALARHDTGARYRMPFGGKEPRVLTEVAGARSGHRGAASHALDFALPWGTPVLAARDGVVVRVEDGHEEGAPRADSHERANRVDVLHADGTLATYAYLRRGAVVEVGQTVATGTPLGFAGGGGHASGSPQLHFMVWEREADLSARGVPIRFHDGSAQGFVPQVGSAYAPGCAANGAGCAEAERPPAPQARPARRADPPARARRTADGGCACGNGAVIHVELPCDQVCGR